MEVMAWRPSMLRAWNWSGVSLRRGRVEDEERADADAGGRDERGAGVEAEGAAGEVMPRRREGRVVAGVGDFEDALAAQ